MTKEPTHRLHMLSFQRIGETSFSVAFGDGKNLQPWHLDLVEQWLAEQRAALEGIKDNAAFYDASDLL